MNFVEIKQEYDEIGSVEEDNFDEHTYEKPEKVEDSCCLCQKGKALRKKLLVHLNNHDDQIFKNGRYSCCKCPEGVQIQKDIVEHLINSCDFFITESDKPSSSFILEINIKNSTETDEDVKKSKPSYHSQYNKRERSPDTEKIQSEFTKCDETKIYFCNFCRNRYKQKQTVERHLIKEHDPRTQEVNEKEPTNQEKPIFYCSICRNGYKHKQTIERHLLKQHNVVVEKPGFKRNFIENFESNKSKKTTETEKFQCDKCGNLYLFRESLRKHLIRHLNPANCGKTGKVAREKIVCDRCSKLVDPSSMKRHFQVHHSKKRPFKCTEPGCTTSFFDISKFNDHKNIHLEIKPYVCEFCSESFHYASNWRQHKLRHTQPERFKCRVCEGCFVSSKSLQNHMRLHTDDPLLKQFTCDFPNCDKEFRYLDRLKLHVLNVHRMEQEMSCKFCSFISTKRKCYKRHLQKEHNVSEGNPRSRVFPPSSTIS